MGEIIRINYDLDEALLLPTAPGVYMIIGDETIYYIGKSGDVRRRVSKQIKDFEQSVRQEIGNGVNAFYIDVILTDTEKDACDLEDECISDYEPPWNDRHT